jgi:tRNA1Val (adenine37-N6)-methyltransferase
MNKPFHFKHFTINQNRCAMKVGTDGVLLGAWTSLEHKPDSILDIGGGTGLIALMLAQRSAAQRIDALEIDSTAFEQCVENFEESIWGDRLFCYHAGLDEFADEVDEKYELIVSNPPFHSEVVPSGNAARDKARQNQSLPFVNLLEGVAKLLSQKGCFSTIIPYKEEALFTAMAANMKLFPNRITHVRGHASAKFKRSLLSLGFDKKNVKSDVLTIEIERHRYTREYIQLTRDFYLKM